MKPGFGDAFSAIQTDMISVCLEASWVLFLLVFERSGQPAPDGTTYKPGDPDYAEKLSDPAIQNALPASPLTNSQLDYFITIEELRSLSDSSYEWEPANDLFSDNSV